jgi:hypothetical protein
VLAFFRSFGVSVVAEVGVPVVVEAMVVVAVRNTAGD